MALIVVAIINVVVPQLVSQKVTVTETVTVTDTKTTTVTVTPTGSYGTVPDLIDYVLETAIGRVSDSGFLPNAIPGSHPQKGVKIVYSQQPAAGNLYPKGETVRFWYNMPGNSSLASVMFPSSGDRLPWGPSGFTVKGSLTNPEKLGDLRLYLLTYSPLTRSYWVQQQPEVMPDGSWTAKGLFGSDTIKTEERFLLVALLTRERLETGTMITQLPKSDSITTIPVTRTAPFAP